MHLEGDIHFWGSQEAPDIYYLIKWCVQQLWCDGTVVMFGNSWLAIAQTNHASICPHPALKATAPWEAATDLYRDFVCRGGAVLKEDKFMAMIAKGFAGYNKFGDMSGILARDPLYTDYWHSKRIRTENIEIPMYQTASYSSRLHSLGSFETFAKADPQRTWLRVHISQECKYANKARAHFSNLCAGADLYNKENMDDLQKFYDRFAKGKDDGWEKTPHLRLSLLAMVGSVGQNVVEIPEQANTFPLADWYGVR